MLNSRLFASLRFNYTTKWIFICKLGMLHRYSKINLKSMFLFWQVTYFTKQKKQLTVSRSSSKAGYIALAAATCELQWLLYVMDDLHMKCTGTLVIYCDNQSALRIVSNHVYEMTKQLKIDCHIVREKQSKGIMKLFLVKSKD